LPAKYQRKPTIAQQQDLQMILCDYYGHLKLRIIVVWSFLHVQSSKGLKSIYPNLTRVTSLAHGLQRIAENIRAQFPAVNDLTASGKKLFLKAPARVQIYKDCLPEVPLPPEPVLGGGPFYQENFNQVKEVVTKLEDEYACARGVSK
jgi:hypothetical protein